MSESVPVSGLQTDKLQILDRNQPQKCNIPHPRKNFSVNCVVTVFILCLFYSHSE